VSLKVSDIDSTRMVLRIGEGRGGKDRLAKLSPLILKELRVWWKAAKPRVFLFPSRFKAFDHISAHGLSGARGWVVKLLPISGNDCTPFA
jgi:integrase